MESLLCDYCNSEETLTYFGSVYISKRYFYKDPEVRRCYHQVCNRCWLRHRRLGVNGNDIDGHCEICIKGNDQALWNQQLDLFISALCVPCVRIYSRIFGT